MNHNEMANVFGFFLGGGNYAAVVKGLKVCFRKTLSIKTEVCLSFGLKPDFRSGLSFGLKLQFKAVRTFEQRSQYSQVNILSSLTNAEHCDLCRKSSINIHATMCTKSLQTDTDRPALYNTHPFNIPLSGTTQVSRYQEGKPIWILLKQETVSGSGIS